MNRALRMSICVVVLWVPALARAQDHDSDTDVDSELEDLRGEQESLDDRVSRLEPLEDRISGYIDIGFFAVGGDGSGTRTDALHENFPEFDDVLPGPWVLMGDPLSTAVNARGEPADLGDSRAIRYDSMNAGNGPTFAVNTLSVTLSAGIGEIASVTAQVHMMPRARDIGDPSGEFLEDFIDVRRAYAELEVPSAPVPVRLYAGKFPSALGGDYGSQDAPQRYTVTPSLVCRYICGNPIGIKGATLLLDRKLAVYAALTNGSNFIESFPFHDEIDRNVPLTGSARVSYRLPDLREGLHIDVAASGVVGPQDNQPDSGIIQWQYGLDTQIELDTLALSAEFVQGSAPGQTSMTGAPCDIAACLDYKATYVLLSARMLHWLRPYMRAGWRSALHQSGVDFVYVSRVFRTTVGARFDIRARVVAKAEYIFNEEMGGIPDFSNDVFASSLVVEY